MTILRRHSSAHRRRSSSNLLQSQAPVTASPVRRRMKEKIHISCVSECADDDEDADDDKVLPAWWVCTKLPGPLFPTFEVLQTSNSSSSMSLSIIIIIIINDSLQSSWWSFFSLQQKKFVHKRFKPSPFPISSASRGFNNFRTSFFALKTSSMLMI